MILRFPVLSLQIEPVKDSAIIVSEFIRSIPVYKDGCDNGTVHLTCRIDTNDDGGLIVSLDSLHGLVSQLIKTRFSGEHSLFQKPHETVGKLELVRLLTHLQHVSGYCLLVILIPSTDFLIISLIVVG